MITGRLESDVPSATTTNVVVTGRVTAQNSGQGWTFASRITVTPKFNMTDFSSDEVGDVINALMAMAVRIDKAEKQVREMVGAP